MLNTILLGAHIRKLLINSEEVTNLLGGQKVFPMAVKMGTTFPFVVFSKSAIEPNYTKDGYGEDTVSLNIQVVDDDYDRANEIANAIRHTIDRRRYYSDQVNFVDIRLMQCQDQFMAEDDCFVVDMIFQVVTGN